MTGQPAHTARIQQIPSTTLLLSRIGIICMLAYWVLPERRQKRRRNPTECSIL